jgi:hypothetical protein
VLRVSRTEAQIVLLTALTFAMFLIFVWFVVV